MKSLKTYLLSLLICILATSALNAQPPGRPDQPRYTIPKETILKPDKSNIKLFSFEKILDDASWHGTRVWHTSTSAVVDSITTLSFFLNSKQVTWTKRGWEYVAAKPGTYTVTNNKIVIQFNYFPYTHYIEGTYNSTTKKITGTFREERVEIKNPPPAYTVGTTIGTIELIQK